MSHISLVALRGQIMTVKVHSGLCMKYSRWDISCDIARVVIARVVIAQLELRGILATMMCFN